MPMKTSFSSSTRVYLLPGACTKASLQLPATPSCKLFPITAIWLRVIHHYQARLSLKTSRLKSSITLAARQIQFLLKHAETLLVESASVAVPASTLTQLSRTLDRVAALLQLSVAIVTKLGTNWPIAGRRRRTRSATRSQTLTALMQLLSRPPPQLEKFPSTEWPS